MPEPSLLSGLSRYAHVAIGFSGGADSTALVWLAAHAELPETRFTAFIVDHGLRPESAAEAEAARQVSEKIGIPARVLTWQGVKPTAGVQAAAREARYKILTEAARAAGAQVLITAHNMDDVAETFLMRLARGSGLDGLAEVPAETELYGMPVRRPLLSVRHQELTELLTAQKISWVEDPSNQSEKFERARLRAAIAQHLAQLGLSIEKIALSASRLSRARHGIEMLTHGFLLENGIAPEIADTSSEESHISRLSLLAEPAEIRIRVLARLMPDAELAQLERLNEWLTLGQGRAMTLAGKHIEVTAGAIHFRKEAPRGKQDG